MNTFKTKIVKRIDLSLKVLFLISTYLYLYFEIFYNNKISILIEGFSINNNIVYKLIFILLLMPINWGIESVKWKYSVKNIQNISFIKSLKATIVSVALGVFTPNRAGEIPGRALFLDKCNLLKATLISSVSAISQLAVTLILGFIFLPFGLGYITTDIELVIAVYACSVFLVVFIFLLYFNVNILSKISKCRLIRKFPNFCKQLKVFKLFNFTMLLNIFLLSLLRYAIFTIQFILILKAFSINLSFPEYLFFVTVNYLIITAIPTIALSEIGVRGAVGVYMFNIMGISNADAEFNLLMATTMLWFINVVIPAFIGTFFISSIKFKKL